MKNVYLLVAVASAIGCSEVTAPATSLSSSQLKASPEVLTNDRTEYTSLTINACNGELVTLAGDQHFVLKLNTGKDGSVKLSISDDLHFTGYGASTGAKYEGKESASEKEAFSVDDFSFVIKQTVSLIGQGKATNTDMDMTMKIKVQADGDVKFSQDFSSRCK
jgi:hypothetical protein